MNKKILIADDDPAIVDAVQIMLEMEGYNVTTTYDGQTVFNLESDYPDIFLLDIWMSGQDGREICQYLKHNPRTKNIPVIMISASRDVINSVNAGADDFIAKPFDIDELLSKVKKYTN